MIDTETLEVVRRMDSGPDPELLDIDHKGDRVYVANEDDGMVTVLRLRQRQDLAEIPVGVEPEGMSVSPDDRITVATSEPTSMAHIIDNATLKVVANVLVDTRPRVATSRHDGKQSGSPPRLAERLRSSTPKTYKIIKKIRLPDSRCPPRGYSTDGHSAFPKTASSRSSRLGAANRVAVVDTATYEVKDTSSSASAPGTCSLNPDGSKLYVVNGLTNDMTVVDAATLKPEKSVPVGRLPWGIVIKP